MAQGPNAPYSRIDQNHITQRVFDENTDRLRVDAEVTATIGTIECIINASSGDNIAITSQDGTKTLLINPDGSINTVVTATDLDIRNLAFATDKVDVSGSSVSISSLPLPPGASTEAKQDSANLLLGAIDTKLGGTIAISAVSLPLPIGAATEATLTSINNKLPTLGQQTSSNSISVTFASDVPTLDVNLNAFTSPTPDSVMTVGAIDGTQTGTKYGLVYNIRQQILASHDRDEQYTYADFGTKNQRITRVEYTSSTFPGFTVRRDFNYTLVSGSYRRDDSVWSVV